MDLPLSAAPRRRAPPQDRLCGRSLASRERRPVASLVAVPRAAPVSVARPRPCPKGTTAPGKPAPCVSRASPDPGCRPSTRRTVRPRPGPGAGGTRRQPSPARPAAAAYGISPRSRCGLPEPHKRARTVHNPAPHMAGFAPQRCRADSFVGHVPLFRGILRVTPGQWTSVPICQERRVRERAIAAESPCRTWPGTPIGAGLPLLSMHR